MKSSSPIEVTGLTETCLELIKGDGNQGEYEQLLVNSIAGGDLDIQKTLNETIIFTNNNEYYGNMTQGLAHLIVTEGNNHLSLDIHDALVAPTSLISTISNQYHSPMTKVDKVIVQQIITKVNSMISLNRINRQDPNSRLLRLDHNIIQKK